MMVGLDRKAGCPSDDGRIIGRWQLQRSEHHDHGRSAARALRISSLLKDGRFRRALVNWRNNRSRLIWSCRSRTVAIPGLDC